MCDDPYMELAQKALSILGIKHDESENFDDLVRLVRHAVMLPVSDTEWQIRIITQNLANALSSRRDREEVENMLAKLDFEVSFLPFD